jgi:hypothetical protein
VQTIVGCAELAAGNRKANITDFGDTTVLTDPERCFQQLKSGDKSLEALSEGEAFSRHFVVSGKIGGNAIIHSVEGDARCQAQVVIELLSLTFGSFPSMWPFASCCLELLPA